MVKLATFDAADYLDDEETIAEYLSAALKVPVPMYLQPPCVRCSAAAAWRGSPKISPFRSRL